ncbi:hypothetical protein [Cupriavidus pauculus]|uniref:hypothetical protein n=1 Tax=Cupriavidus pauculus TaxID=82633 RepID=UPI000A467DCD|nr:hypothetical protein [Cupriavidus pauculus]
MDNSHFSLPDFRIAFLLSGALTLVSLIGYPGLANDAGRNLADKTGGEPTGTPSKAAN